MNWETFDWKWFAIGFLAAQWILTMLKLRRCRHDPRRR